MEFKRSTAFGFEVKISRKDEAFPLGLPPIGGSMQPISPSGYLDKKNKDVARRLRRDEFEVQNILETGYVPLLTDMHARFGDMLDQYDKEIIMPSTVALGLIKPTHTDLDEIGTLGMHNDFEYSQETVDAVKAFYNKYMYKESDFTLSLPRGKNTAYPFIVSGMQREANDCALTMQATLSIGAKKAGWRAAELADFLAKYHGPLITVYGERYQHTPKVMPMSLSGGLHFSHNVEPRARGIYMSPKFLVAYNRKTVKKALKTFLQTPVHVQDRKEIARRISAAQKKGWIILALDYKKFDQRAGGKRGHQVLRTISEIWSVDTTFDDLRVEFDSKLVSFRQGQCYTNDTHPILMSGASFTSIVGGTTNVFSTTQAVSASIGVKPSELWAKYGTTWDYLAWGDDTLLMMDPKHFEKAKVMESFKDIQMPIDEEPVVKYLGSVYGDGESILNVRRGYSLGRALQQQFLPERRKEWPFSTIGYVARLELMGPDGKAFHERMLKKWDIKLMGNPFQYSEKEKVIIQLLPEVEKYASKIAQVDDILQTLTHGLEAEDVDHLEFSQFEGLLGLSMADLSDPLKFAKDQKIDPRIISLMGDILKGDFNQYEKLLTHYTMQYNLQWRRGDVVY